MHHVRPHRRCRWFKCHVRDMFLYAEIFLVSFCKTGQTEGISLKEFDGSWANNDTAIHPCAGCDSMVSSWCSFHDQQYHHHQEHQGQQERQRALAALSGSPRLNIYRGEVDSLWDCNNALSHAYLVEFMDEVFFGCSQWLDSVRHRCFSWLKHAVSSTLLWASICSTLLCLIHAWKKLCFYVCPWKVWKFLIYLSISVKC